MKHPQLSDALVGVMGRQPERRPVRIPMAMSADATHRRMVPATRAAKPG